MKFFSNCRDFNDSFEPIFKTRQFDFKAEGVEVWWEAAVFRFLLANCIEDVALGGTTALERPTALEKLAALGLSVVSRETTGLKETTEDEKSTKFSKFVFCNN